MRGVAGQLPECRYDWDKGEDKREEDGQKKIGSDDHKRINKKKKKSLQIQLPNLYLIYF